MGKKIACNVFTLREVDQKDADGNPMYERVTLKPGDDASELPKEDQERMEKAGTIVDEKRLAKDGAYRIPYGQPDRELPQAAQQGQERAAQKKATARKGKDEQEDE